MANLWYKEGLQWYLEAGAAFSTDASLKVALMNAGYTAANTDTGFASIVANQVGASVALPTKSDAAGVATGGTVTFSGIASGLTVKTIVIYHETGAGAGKLICAFDTGTGLPLTTTGADIKVEWNATDPTGTIGSL